MEETLPSGRKKIMQTEADAVNAGSFFIISPQEMCIRDRAQVLHMNENTVKTRLYSSLRKLKCLIETQEVIS